MKASEILLALVPILVILAFIFGMIAEDKKWKITKFF